MSKEKPWVAVVHIRDKHCDVCGSEIYDDELYYTRAWCEHKSVAWRHMDFCGHCYKKRVLGHRQEQEKLTYNEWKNEGFRVLAGQHSREKNRYGEAIFYRTQVEEDPYHTNPNLGEGQRHD
jgi:hypothetical protein